MVNAEIRLIIFSSAEDRYSSIQSAKIRPGADCGSDHHLPVATFKLNLKKAGEITRPVRYELNQIPYEYTVEVTNRFKRLDLIDIVPEELWMEVGNTVQEAVTKIISEKNKWQEGSVVVRRSLTNS